MNIYDFDNTIYDGESAVDFFFFCLKKHPSLLKLLPLMMIKLIKYKLCRISIEELEFYIEKYAFSIITLIGDIEKEAEAFWDKNICKIKDFYKNQQKEDDLILSATAGFLLSGFSERMGGVKYICSEIDIKTGKIQRVCFRSKKAEVLKSVYPDDEIDAFYTDSMNDKPIIDIAKNAYLVRGNKIKKIK